MSGEANDACLDALKGNIDDLVFTLSDVMRENERLRARRWLSFWRGFITGLASANLVALAAWLLR